MSKDKEFYRDSLTIASQNKGKSWEEIQVGSNLFDYVFKCKDCNVVLPKGFVVSPRFCPYCGKEHG